MTGEFAAAAAVIAIAVVVVGLLFTMASAIRAMATFRRSVEQITGHTLPLISDMHAAIKQANSDLIKVDTLLDTAESISTTMDSASRLAYTAVASPVVKTLAAGTGMARAWRLFRRRRAKAEK
ncbi:MAG TPA: hypothetical protein VF045_01175 [Acidimicrobiales bacterium]|jgi:predicted PurR-regulated permease PerM